MPLLLALSLAGACILGVRSLMAARVCVIGMFERSTGKLLRVRLRVRVRVRVRMRVRVRVRARARVVRVRVG